MGSRPAYPKISLWLVMLATLSHCASVTKGGVESKALRRPLADIRKAVYFTMDNRVKYKSENNRTYFSYYHRPGKDLRLSSYKQNERALLAITILGDQRPYRVAVVYRIDQLNGKKYQFKKYDKTLAASYLEKLVNYLASRPEERDIIDDFRAY